MPNPRSPFCLLFFLLTFNAALGQINPQIDSLKSLLADPEIQDSSRLVIHNKLGELLIYQDPDSAYFYLSKATSLSLLIQDSSNLARSYLLKAITFEGQSVYDSAIRLNMQAYNIYEALKDTIFMGNVKSNLGINYESIGNKEKGLTYHLDALRLFESTNHLLGIAKTYNNLGILYKTMDSLNKASEYYEKSAAIFQKMNYPFGQAALLNNAANVQYELGAYHSALITARKALQLFIENEIEQYQPASLEIIGSSLLQLNRQLPTPLWNTHWKSTAWMK
jgi:tetratricopeptide (TPR) repeat protein